MLTSSKSNSSHHAYFCRLLCLSLIITFSLPIVHSVVINCSLAVDVDTLYSLENVTDDGLAIDYSQPIDLTLSSAGELCTLSRTVATTINQQDQDLYQPMGRSYNGYDWERVAGPGRNTLSYDCTTSETTCRVTIPVPLEGESYHLARYTHSLSETNEISRFLHRITWGPTLEEINNFQGSQASNVYHHIYNISASLHRAYFRRRAGARALQMTKAALTGPQPCEAGSRWRKFAFTKQDLYLSTERTKTVFNTFNNPQYMVHCAILSPLDDNSNAPVAYSLSFASQIRTIIYEPLTIEGGSRDGTTVDMDGQSYRLCRVDEIEGSARSYPDRLGIYYPDVNGDDRCMFIRGGNPSVNLDPIYYDSSADHILDLTDEDITAVNNDVSAPGSSAGGLWRLNSEVDDQVACSSLPDPYDNDYRDKTDFDTGSGTRDNWGRSHVFDLDPPVFGLLPNGSYALHDTVLLLQENSFESPLADGGGSATLRSATKADDGNFSFLPHATDPSRSSRLDGEEQAVWCSNDVPSFVNEENCYLSSSPNACIREEADHEDIALAVTLDDNTLAGMFSLTGRHVYAVTGIAFDTDSLVDPPCAENGVLYYAGQATVFSRDSTRSRWIPAAEQTICDTDPSNLQSSTESIFADLLSQSTDVNPYVRDVVVWRTAPQCDELDREMTGMVVRDHNGTCWQNVHPEYLSVYDMTLYIANYPDETGAITPNNDTGRFVYPLGTDFYTMDHWEEVLEDETKLKERRIGRYGDLFEINDLATNMKIYDDSIANGNSASTAREETDEKILAIANTLGQAQLETQMTRDGNGGGILVCGNPGEVTPDPDMDDNFDLKNLRIDGSEYYTEQRQTVWTTLALEAPDQLRQRMAWALNKILNIATSLVVDRTNTETFLYLYDIYVRHAFGNYFDILKEMAFNAKMAEQLTFARNLAIRVKWDQQGILQFPDENFAREIMQLFSTGLHKIDMDGTPQLDNDGLPIRVYETEHILTFARVWTGAFYNLKRGNVEELDHVQYSRMDVMRFNPNNHDFAPKRDLVGGWIGDRYPLCTDLPDQPFLKIGAKFMLLGSQSNPRMQWVDPKRNYEGDVGVRRLVLRSNHSQLYDKLCASDGTKCTYPPVVKLDENLVCDDAECRVDMIRVVQVEPGVFYEYIRQPCVQMAFYVDAKQVNGRGNIYQMCANPAMPVATRTCCGRWPWAPSNPSRFNNSAVYHEETEFHGELVKYETNKDLCSRLSGHTCPPEGNDISDLGFPSDSINTNFPAQNLFHWSSGTCTLKLKVQNDGIAAIIHEPSYTDRVISYVNINSTYNFFSIPWNLNEYTMREMYPTSENGCGGDNTCILQSDGSCLCNIDVIETSMFSTIPTREEVLRELFVGAWDPNMLENFTLIESSGEVEVYSLQNEDYSTSTIFKVANEFNETIFLKNIKSEIQVGETYTIRNMPHFMDMVAPETRDAHHEIDAVIHHFVRHESTAPNICIQLIKHFGVSNPSPRYVKTVATAFREGVYVHEDGTETLRFGDGKVGNLAATAAAILLDREATSPVLDADPSHGTMREPILKVVSLMRSLEYTRTEQDKMIYPILDGMADKIGQMAYDAPAQFSFFSPEYSPPGQFSGSGLVSPESELLTIPNTVGIINGMFSLIRQGLSSMDSGFGGRDIFGENYDISGYGAVNQNDLYDFDYTIIGHGNYNKSLGYLLYTHSGPSGEDYIEELNTLLLGGRLSDNNRAILSEQLDRFTDEFGEDVGKRAVQQLLVTTPEFHSTTIDRKNGQERNSVTPPEPSEEPYKAIVYFYLFGGWDSFNVLTPYDGGNCGNLYSQYLETRGIIGMATNELLPIDAGASNQTNCDTFGVHNRMPALRNIYNDGYGIFLANMGHLSKPVTQDNWRTETNTDLFSHTTMRDETMLVDAFKQEAGTGVLGRMMDVSKRNGMAVRPVSIENRPLILGGNPQTGEQVNILPRSGPKLIFHREFFNVGAGREHFRRPVAELNADTTLNSGLYGVHWSQNLIQVWNDTENLKSILDQQSVAPMDGGAIGQAFETITKMIAAHEERKTNRDVFYLSQGGFDMHSNVKLGLNTRLPLVNSAVQDFYDELVNKDLLDKVTVIIGSEFGRTLTPNTGDGSDHGWGGNYFMFGGELDGGRILGKYPSSFNASDETDIGRGRVLPTMSWDAMWYGVAQWFGITSDEDMKYVLPNNENFGCDLFSDKDLYTTGNNSVPGCGGLTRTIEVQMSLYISEPRYLTGLQQKAICEVAISKITGATGSKTRCIIKDQNIIISYERRRLQDPPSTPSMSGNRILSDSDPNPIFSIEFIPELTVTADVRNADTANLMAETAEEAAQNIVPNSTGVNEIVVLTSDIPSPEPTAAPTPGPTAAPSPGPTAAPSPGPTAAPSLGPTPAPSPGPTRAPFSGPTLPTPVPSPGPTPEPSPGPTTSATSAPPTLRPTRRPTRKRKPSRRPTRRPIFTIPIATPRPKTLRPSFRPTNNPSSPRPTLRPTGADRLRCVDSPLMFSVSTNNGKKSKFKRCQWVAKKPGTRCSKFTGVETLCPSTCGTCHMHCHDAELTFKFKHNGEVFKRNCNEVANQIGLCKVVIGVGDTCQKTCRACATNEQSNIFSK